MRVNKKDFRLHDQQMKEMITKDLTITDNERKYCRTIIGYIGHETDFEGALERLEYVRKIIEEYRENKLQDKRVTNVGFDFS